MFMRQLATVALAGAVLVSVGCSCCHKRTVVSNAPCCGGPPGAVAVPAVPAAPAVPPAPVPVTSGFAPAAPCPNGVGR